MIQPPARLGEGESAGRRPDPASSANRKIPPKLNQPPPLRGGETIALIVNQINILVDN